MTVNLPEPVVVEKSPKNPDIVQDDTDEEEVDDDPWTTHPKGKMTLMWAKLKTQ